jgi:hypothetical protein
MKQGSETLACQLVANGLSASPSPTTGYHQVGLVKDARRRGRDHPNSPTPSCMLPGVSGATWLGIPTEEAGA